MYPPKFDYHRASSVEEAISLMQGNNGAKLLAGGLSLIPTMNLRLANPSALIDIGRIDGLKGISVQNGNLRIGALTTHSMVAASNQNGLPQALKEAAGNIGDPQVRNRGTVGGNVSHADPASDLPTVFTMLGANFHITGPSGSRTVAASDFFTDFFQTALDQYEILTAIEIPMEGTGSGSAYSKMANPASRYAMVGAAASVTAGMNGECSACSVAIGGLTTHATPASSVSSALTGQPLNHDQISAAARAIYQDLGDDLIGDIHASAEYRRNMAVVFVERVLKTASERAAQSNG